MQKFTRPLTREVELAGGRLAFTFSEQGLAVRPVGSRRPPREISWSALLVHMMGPAQSPSAEEVTAAVESLKKGEGAKPAVQHASAAEPVPAGGQSHLPM
jgi:hypothetical protein